VTSNSTVATGPSWHMTHKAWNAQIYARVGNRRRGTRKLMQQQHVNDTRIGFLNARGMGDRTFRQYLLAQYRRRFHILALAETWCPGRNEEREWAKDWKKSGGVVWASGPPATADNQHGFKGRGIGIFFADCLGEVAEQCEKIIRDPEGRILTGILHAPRQTKL
jgi:hypothetical protein